MRLIRKAGRSPSRIRLVGKPSRIWSPPSPNPEPSNIPSSQRTEQHDQVPSDADAPREERAKQLFEPGPSLVSGCEQDRRQARTEGPQEDEEEQQGW